MTATAPLRSLQPSAIVKGLVAFLVMTVFIPLLATIVASFGPQDWVVRHYDATRSLEPILFVFAGIVVALVIAPANMFNALVAAMLGAIISLILAIALGASPHLGAAGLAFEYLLLPMAWFVLGAALVPLAKRVRNAL